MLDGRKEDKAKKILYSTWDKLYALAFWRNKIKIKKKNNRTNNYLLDGRLENNNNSVERAIKSFASGRKNWLFSNSVDSAHTSIIIYSFTEICKYNNLSPYHWLTYVLKKIPRCKTEKELQLLRPYNIDKVNLIIPSS